MQKGSIAAIQHTSRIENGGCMVTPEDCRYADFLLLIRPCPPQLIKVRSVSVKAIYQQLRWEAGLPPSIPSKNDHAGGEKNAVEHVHGGGGYG